MTERTKLIAEILGFIIVIVLIGWALWALFFRTPGTPLIPGTKEAPLGGLPTIGEGGERNLVGEGASLLEPEPEMAVSEAPDVVARGGRTQADPLIEARADFATLTGNGFNYYNENDGRFYRLSASGGEPVLLSDEVFRSVQDITWSGSGNKAVLEFPDGSNVFYNFKTKEKATLPRAAQDFSFSSNEEALAYEYIGEGVDERWLVASKPNGEGQQLVEPLGAEASNVQVSWSPDNQVVALFRESNSALGEEVFFIGLNNENFLSLQTNGIGFKGKWSPAGEQILYSVYSEKTGYNPMLHIAGSQGEGIGEANRSLKISTWPDKCVFGNETLLYCAVPQNLPEGSGLYPELAIGTSDVIYKIDLYSNLAVPLARPQAGNDDSFSVNNLMLSPSGSELYFTDRVSGGIYHLRLR